MIEEEKSSSGRFDNLKERRNAVSRSLGDERSAKAPQRGIKVSQTLLEPPS